MAPTLPPYSLFTLASDPDKQGSAAPVQLLSAPDGKVLLVYRALTSSGRTVLAVDRFDVLAAAQAHQAHPAAGAGAGAGGVGSGEGDAQTSDVHVFVPVAPLSPRSVLLQVDNQQVWGKWYTDGTSLALLSGLVSVGNPGHRTPSRSSLFFHLFSLAKGELRDDLSSSSVRAIPKADLPELAVCYR